MKPCTLGTRVTISQQVKADLTSFKEVGQAPADLDAGDKGQRLNRWSQNLKLPVSGP